MGDNMIAIILAGAFGGIALTSSVWVYVERHKPQPEPVDITAIVEQTMQLHKPSINLTEPDLLKVPCSADYIADYGQGLCREMFCRMTGRGIDAKTSGKECEEISNLINKTAVHDVCSKAEDFKACVDLYDRRL